MITQVEMTQGAARQVAWVKSETRPRVGQTVKHATGDWLIREVYNSFISEREVHVQHGTVEVYPSLFQECFG